MSRTSRLWLRTGLTLLVAVVAVGNLMSAPAMAASGRSLELQGIYPLGAQPYGRSWGEWTASWWQWAMSMPISANPLMETADCTASQSGPVWFLGGSFVNATVTRDCTIPAGKAILFPVLNVECSTVEPPPFFGENEAELRACVASMMDATADYFAFIDGQPVENLENYRLQSPLFSFSAPADNVLFVPGPVSGESVSDGVWLLLTPMSAGNHTIRFGGTFTGFGLTLDVTYNITVLPGGRGRGQIAGDIETWGTLKQLYR